MSPPLIALDWGTTRARAYLVGEDGAVIDRRLADQGIQSVPEGGFPAAFADLAGPLLDRETSATILLAGMVGSRNGWVEAPYVACPATAEAIAEAAITVETGHGPARILPGLSCDEGAFDVMRGEETLVIGLGLSDGLVCLPGTHSKWALVEGGAITRFASFMTGEVYGLLRERSILSRLAEEPVEGDAEEGLRRGFEAALREGGLLNAAFAARTEVLAGRLAPRAVGPFLSALLVGQEIAGALRLFGHPAEVHLVADGPLAASYGAGLDAAGIRSRRTTPEEAFLAGVARIAEALPA